MKKICLVIHSLDIGGMERVMAHIATDFASRMEVEVHLVLIGMKRNIEYSIPESVVVHRPSFQFNNSRRKFDTLRTIHFLRAEVKKINPDVILSFGELWNNLVLLSLYGLSYPIYISDRSEPNKNLGKLHNFLRNKLYPMAAGFIAQTEDAKKVCISNSWNTNVQVIGNPIRNIKQNHLIDRENIVLTVGRLIKTKHIDLLIRMFSEIDQPNWKLVIVGGDAKKMTLSKELRKLIKDLGVEDRVSLEGQRKDVDRYYNQSKIFAFTSSSEGFPNVIGEALSAGLPVIAFDCTAGPSDLIQNGKNGFLIELFDQNLFRKKMQLLMENEDLRNKMSEYTLLSIEKFKPKVICNKFYSFLTEKI